MANGDPVQKSVPNLVIILRVMGAVSLLALIFVFVPSSWMNAIHQTLGLGELSVRSGS